MMRRVLWFATVVLMGCPSDGNEGTSETEGTSTGGDTGTTTTTRADSTGTDESTGGSMDGLEPCDPTVDGACAAGDLCAGAPQAGFYCRPACSEMADEGTECESDGVCLPIGAGNEGLACFQAGECDLLSAEGCDLASGESCVAISLDPLRTACVPSGSTTMGESCDPLGMHDCGPGLACLGSDIDDGDPGICTLICLPGMPLPDACPTCTPLNPEIGTCTECSVLDDQCPRGQQCQPINEFLGGVCVDHGPLGPGETCNPLDPAMACQADHLCLETEVDDLYTCVETCDPKVGMCSGDEACIDVGVIVPGAKSGQLGLCIEGVDQICDPDAMPTGCEMGDICLEFGAGLGICGGPCDPTLGTMACGANEFCFPELDGAAYFDPFVEGNGACGGGCSSDMECAGGTCLLLDGLTSDGLCGTTCDPANGGVECMPGEDCVPTPGDPMIGACVLGGGTCDPTLSGRCPPPTGACIGLDGGAPGACMSSCFVQDPSPCGGAAVCHGKTDPRWHDGICLGGGAPCDPIAQDCGPGQTCEVVGGGPIGGTAFLCDSAGPLPEGADCSGEEACGEALFCLDDVCVATCDPGAPACMSGSCSDISVRFYLPPETIGACL